MRSLLDQHPYRFMGALSLILVPILVIVIALGAPGSAASGVAILGSMVVMSGGFVVLVRGIDSTRAATPSTTHGLRQPVGAGWYPDPETPSLRFWDGEQWTDQRAPLPPRQQSSNQSVFTIARGVSLGLILFSIISWVIYNASTSGDEFECMEQNYDRAMQGSSYVEDCD